MATPIRNLRVDDETWGRWQARAKARGISLTALITEAMDAPAALPPPKLLNTRSTAPQPPTLVNADTGAALVGRRRIDAPVQSGEKTETALSRILPSSGAHFPKQLTWAQKQAMKPKGGTKL